MGFIGFSFKYIIIGIMLVACVSVLLNGVRIAQQEASRLTNMVGGYSDLYDSAMNGDYHR